MGMLHTLLRFDPNPELGPACTAAAVIQLHLIAVVLLVTGRWQPLRVYTFDEPLDRSAGLWF